MNDTLILFIVVMTLSAISFIAAICSSIYFKRKNFELKGEVTISELAKKFTTVSVAINASVLITLITTLLSTMISPGFVFMGLIIFFVMCGVSIVVCPAVSLLGIVFSVVSVKRAQGKKLYILCSALSMFISFGIMFLYINIVF